MSDFPKNGVPQGPNGNGTVKFGAFEADLHAGEVRKSGSRVKLQEQPFKVLQVLLERPGTLVTREELRSRIWPDDSFGDFDHAVNVAERVAFNITGQPSIQSRPEPTVETVVAPAILS